MKTALLWLSALACTSTIAPAAPAVKATTKIATARAPKISIDPAAKAILERAAKLYGATNKWSGQVVQIGPCDHTPNKIAITFSRPNLVRIESHSDQTTSMAVANGTTVSSFLKDPELGTITRVRPQYHTLFELLESSEAIGTGDALSILLQGKTGLDGPDLKRKMDGAISFTAKLLPTAIFKGQSCQRVVLERRYKPTGDDWREEESDELWFTTLGKLVKTIATERTQESDGDSWTSEITAQDFAPVFTPQTFVLKMPKAKPGKM